MALERGEEGQATLEAALLLPVLSILIALLVQPACILYTRCVMQVVAAEGCRLITTAVEDPSGPWSPYRTYLLRRLAAVPDAPIFHVGGEDGWEIELDGSETQSSVTVVIRSSVRPLPLLGVVPQLLGEVDGEGNVVVEATQTMRTRPSWLEGSYAEWSSIW